MIQFIGYVVLQSQIKHTSESDKAANNNREQKDEL